MSATKHTPGPWEISKQDKPSDLTIVVGANAAANARLIAASPLMYDYIRAHAVAGCEQAAAILRAVEGTETT